MPLFSWMKWSHETKAQAQDETPSLKLSGGLPSRTLITELLWHVEERERLARELEREHRLAHGALGLHWYQKYPRLRTLIPSSELQQLEYLCAQIPPVQAATVLSRCLAVPIASSVLTLASCQQRVAAIASTRPDSRQRRPKGERELGQAAKKAIMCYCHRHRRYRVLTCEGERCPVRVSEARLPGLPLISVNQYGKTKEQLLGTVEHCDLLTYFP